MEIESAAKTRAEKMAMNVARRIFFMNSKSVSALEMLLDFFQRFSFRLRQDKRGGQKINHRASGEYEKHRGIAILADGRQKDSGDGGGDADVDAQGNAHSIGTDARGHQFR